MSAVAGLALVLAACGGEDAAQDPAGEPATGEGAAGDGATEEAAAEDWDPEVLFVHLPNPGSLTEQIGRNLISLGLEPNFDGNIRITSHQAGTNDAFAAVLSEPDVDEGIHMTLITNHSVVASLSGSAPFDFEDLQGLGTLATTAMAVAAPADSPWDSLEDLAEDAREDAAAIRVSLGAPAGSLHHITTIRLQEALGATGDFSIIPHTDAGEGTLTLLGGGAELGVGTPSGYFDQVELGKLKFLAVLGEERSLQAPDAPTAIEQGFDFAQENQMRVVTGSSVPPERVQWLSDLLESAITEPEFQASLEEMAWNPVHRSAEETQEDFQDWAVFTRDILAELGL